MKARQQCLVTAVKPADVDGSLSAVVQRARELARKHLAGPLPQRFRHTVAVAERASWLAHGLLAPERAEIVVAAAWLHDIGYAPDLVEAGFHPIDGARHIGLDSALAAGCPSLVGLIAHHTGAQFEARERGLEAQMGEFPMPDVAELAILSCADLCSGPDGRPVGPEERIAEVLVRYPPDHPVHRAISRSGPGLIAQARSILTAVEKVTS